MTLTTKKDSTERHYFMNTTKMLKNVRCEKDLGVLTDHKLNFDLHIAEKIKTANSMLAIIKKCFMKLNCQSLSGLPVTWLNTIWLIFFVESFGLKILGQVTRKLSQLYVNSRKYHNVGHMRCMHARPHRRKDQLPLRSLRDLRSR